MNLQTTLIVFLCFCATTVLRAERVDMLKAGAKANGKTLNTKLINSTIDRLNRGGGGTLFFPAGTYLTGSIHLKSNITLELEAGATLLFSDNFDDYLPFVEVRHEGVMMKSFQPLIYAVDAENITIKGEGTLDGQGMSGSVRKVTISNCVFDGTDRGIRIKSTRGRGGVVEDIRVSNVVMSNIKQEAVVLNLKYSKMPAEPKSERTPIFRNVHISGMTVTNVKTPIKIVGLEEAPISDIVLRDIHIQEGKQKCIFENCERITMDDVIVNGEVIKSTTNTTD